MKKEREMNIETRKIVKTEADFGGLGRHVLSKSFRSTWYQIFCLNLSGVLTLFLTVALLCGKKVKLASS